MNQMFSVCVCVSSSSDQLLVQAEGAVVLLRVRAVVQSRGQRQREGVTIRELPHSCSEVASQTGHMGG